MFDMEPAFTPAATAARFSIGTPSPLSAAPLEPMLRLYNEVGIDVLRARSLALTDHLIGLTHTHLRRVNISIATPREHRRRGGHVAIRHADARYLVDELLKRGVVADFRNPDIIRLAPVLLYNDEADCLQAVQTLSQILQALLQARKDARA